MFKEGSLNRKLSDLFDECIEQTKVYPGTIYTKGQLTGTAYSDVDSAVSFMNGLKNKWLEYFEIPYISEQKVLTIGGGYSDDLLLNKTKQITYGYIEGLKEHADLVSGVWYDESDLSDSEIVKEALQNGAIPCVVSVKSYESSQMTVGSTYYVELKTTNDRDNFLFVVVGIIEEKDDGEPFWNRRLTSFDSTLFTGEEYFSLLMKSYNCSSIEYMESVMLDYTYINYDNAEETYSYAYQFQNIDSKLKTNFRNILVTYIESKKTISIILLTFEIPIVALLLLFIYMISSRIIEMETGEIAMLKSRGISRIKIIMMYFLQSVIISGVGALIGLPFGYLFCKLGASTDAFLVFTLKDTSIYEPNLSMLIFAGIAFLASLLFMTIPVIPLSKFTIIERRSNKIGRRSKPFWERFFLDIPLLALALYLLFNYMKQRDSIALTVISGGQIDPVMFLDSTFFILGCGLFSLRLLHLLVNIIYKIGKTKWKPAEYVAFLQIIRNTGKQGFIAVFLVMTIAMGIFNSNLARSVNENMENRINYNTGCDYILEENWILTIVKDSIGGDPKWRYTEPDYQKYNPLKDIGVNKMTRVIRDNNAEVNIGRNKETGVMLMGINTKEFGETASLQNGLNDKHWYNYLNELGGNPNGILISSNFAEKYDLKVGDKLDYGRIAPVNTNKVYATNRSVIVGIVDAFPGYESIIYKEDSEGLKKQDMYLIVANYNTVVDVFRTRPYEIWMNMDDAKDYDAIDNWLDENKIRTVQRISRMGRIEAQRNSTLIQITNGMFSIGFIISLTVCAVGFLIYWILTIRERELIYGIYRSMGLSMGEIFRMLIVEQIFSSLLSCVSGFGVGMLTSLLFIRLISLIYLPREHIIPISIMCKAQDGMKMGIIVTAVFVICFMIIFRIIKNMNITKAIKLGED